ncbi:hypothetical protein B9Z19DRAFT_773569 [Tuber borchii]|uniref:Uncharacterized protein n=1 Tax=Tuber borchii TaxID=42251 RepID=A0A2T6ZWT9_TUBBO|nr:hypothetical protein B9Z19DRAFT_773569 [Tuber borchii]
MRALFPIYSLALSASLFADYRIPGIRVLEGGRSAHNLFCTIFTFSLRLDDDGNPPIAQSAWFRVGCRIYCRGTKITAVQRSMATRPSSSPHTTYTT